MFMNVIKINTKREINSKIKFLHTLIRQMAKNKIKTLKPKIASDKSQEGVVPS